MPPYTHGVASGADSCPAIAAKDAHPIVSQRKSLSVSSLEERVALGPAFGGIAAEPFREIFRSRQSYANAELCLALVEMVSRSFCRRYVNNFPVVDDHAGLRANRLVSLPVRFLTISAAVAYLTTIAAFRLRAALAAECAVVVI